MKILFLQLESPTIGGIWGVNKVLALKFSLKNEVTIISARKSDSNYVESMPSNIKMITINNNSWDRVRINQIKRKKSFKLLKERLKQNESRKKDYQMIRNYILDIKPDVIINSHYELLDSIPNSYLKKTVNVFHTSYKNIKENNRFAINKLKKYQTKIGKLVWLTKETYKNALKDGLTNSTYIYNPVKFEVKDLPNISSHKKLVTIARLSSKEKNIDEMIKIVDKVFKECKDWSFELYGPGLPSEKSLEIIKNNPRIELKGITNNSKEVLLSSSIYLSTSLYEGFSLSILEANTCGLPVLTYNFGESCSEEVIDKKTGFIVSNENEFAEKLKQLINNNKLLEELSQNAFEFSKNFNIDIIINEWYKLFDGIGEL